MSAIDDAALLKMAECEILGEAKRAAARHSIAGVSGWQPCSKLNKTFLTNTLLQAMASNRILSRKKGNRNLLGKKIERKFLQTNAVEKDSDFMYRKPKEKKTKSLLNTSTKKCEVKRNKSENKRSKSAKEVKKKCNTANVKLKTT